MRTWILANCIGGLLAAFAYTPVVHAQDTALVEKAKKEGEVSIYSISPTPVVEAFAKQFQKQYGIKVDIFRAGGAQIEQKLSLELRTRRVSADVIELGDPTAITRLGKKGAIAHYVPKNSAGFEKSLLDKDGYWTTIAQNIFPIIYNKEKITESEAPQQYKDLADPKWKGKLALASPNYGSTQLTFAKGLVEIDGWGIIDSLKKNDPVIARGWPDLENLISTGEADIGPDISIRTLHALKDGAPLGVIYPSQGVIAVQDVMGIMKAAPHPDAARLLLEFYLSDAAQKLMAASGSYPVKKDAGQPEGLKPLGQIKLHYVNLDEYEAQHDKLVSRWTDTLER